jgi:hypothetical protein
MLSLTRTLHQSVVISASHIFTNSVSHHIYLHNNSHTTTTTTTTTAAAGAVTPASTASASNRHSVHAHTLARRGVHLSHHSVTSSHSLDNLVQPADTAVRCRTAAEYVYGQDYRTRLGVEDDRRVLVAHSKWFSDPSPMTRRLNPPLFLNPNTLVHPCGYTASNSPFRLLPCVRPSTNVLYANHVQTDKDQTALSMQYMPSGVRPTGASKIMRVETNSLQVDAQPVLDTRGIAGGDGTVYHVVTTRKQQASKAAVSRVKLRKKLRLACSMIMPLHAEPTHMYFVSALPQAILTPAIDLVRELSLALQAMRCFRPQTRDAAAPHQNWHAAVEDKHSLQHLTGNLVCFKVPPYVLYHNYCPQDIFSGFLDAIPGMDQPSRIARAAYGLASARNELQHTQRAAEDLFRHIFSFSDLRQLVTQSHNAPTPAQSTRWRKRLYQEIELGSTLHDTIRLLVKSASLHLLPDMIPRLVQLCRQNKEMLECAHTWSSNAVDSVHVLPNIVPLTNVKPVGLRRLK